MQPKQILNFVGKTVDSGWPIKVVKFGIIDMDMQKQLIPSNKLYTLANDDINYCRIVAICNDIESTIENWLKNVEILSKLAKHFQAQTCHFELCWIMPGVFCIYLIK